MNLSANPEVRLVVREDREWEQVVMVEVLVPETPNVYGDYWTRPAIVEAAYMFMEKGFGIDIEHDNVDRTGDIQVVESFIARAGDPDFIEGSWVLGFRIHNGEIWNDILDGKINGVSYEALVSWIPATLEYYDSFVRTGITEPYLEDGHVHEYAVVVDETNRPKYGGTSEMNGHAHAISTHTVTDIEEGHNHRYTLVQGRDGK